MSKTSPRSSSKTRVLIVDDHDVMRKAIRNVIGNHGMLEVCGEACNGLDAIQKVQELKPNVVLLDVGMPVMDGFEATRHIRQLAPHIKIVIVTVHDLKQVRELAASLGAHAMIAKDEVPHSLSKTITDVMGPPELAVLVGKRFVRSDLDFSVGTKARVSHRHEILFCSSDSALLDGLSRFILTTLNTRSAVIALVRDEHRGPLLERLRARGVDVDSAIQQGTLIPCGVHEALSMFVVDDWPDSVRFSRAVGDLIRRAGEGSESQRRRVVACGECAPTLWAEGKVKAAIQVEHLWDEMTQRHGVDTLCVYPSLQDHPDDLEFENLCAEHTAVCSQ